MGRKSNAQSPIAANASIELNGPEYQKMYGFGACFNELGRRALRYLSAPNRKILMQELFSSSDENANFNLCRIPIGANDYSFNWYSLDESPDDYALQDFFMARDKQALIPYIKKALSVNPQISLFASPPELANLDEKPARI